MAHVAVTDLHKAFGAVVAADDVSLDVPSQSILTLLGPSGCGKTTTLRCVAGLERPDAGEIRFGETVVYSSRNGIFVPADRRQIGMVFQSYAIWPHMTVYENVAYPLKVRGVPAEEVRRRVREMLALVRLEGLEDRPAPHLSGGQQQRVALARALVHDPQLLLLDEPLSNLDANLRERMRVELKDLQRRVGITTLYVTHDQLEALAISDRIALMHAGQVVAVGSAREIYERPRNRFAAEFVGRTNFLVGKVVEADSEDRWARVATSFGELLCHTHGEPVQLGEEVLIGVKPENVDLVAKPTDGRPNTYRGRIEVALYLGAHIEYQVAVDGQLLRVQERRHPATQLLERGTEVFVEMAPAACAIIRTQ